MEWQVIKLHATEFAAESLGIHKGHTDWYDYDVLEYCSTQEDANKSMIKLSNELNITCVNY